MYPYPYAFPHPYHPYDGNLPYYAHGPRPMNRPYPSPYWAYAPAFPSASYPNSADTRIQWPHHHIHNIDLKDYGRQPYVVNINRAAKQNRTFRTALWTGKHLQVTLMSINVGEEIGLEIHPDTDQFIRIEQGEALVQMGEARDHLHFERRASKNDAIMIPAGTWHNVINTGNTPLKFYSIYAPPEHPFGTVHETKAEALAAEERKAN